MFDYRRAYFPGGTYFFTLVIHRRRPIFRLKNARDSLHKAIDKVRGERPLTINAMVLLPDHLHMIMTLPRPDADYSTRLKLIKHHTSRGIQMDTIEAKIMSTSRRKRGERGLWQRRFWEHVVRDETEYETLCNYIHYNPVKHGYATCPHLWPYSTFHRFARERRYEADWLCLCHPRNRVHEIPEIDEEIVGE